MFFNIPCEGYFREEYEIKISYMTIVVSNLLSIVYNVVMSSDTIYVCISTKSTDHLLQLVTNYSISNAIIGFPYSQLYMQMS